MEAKSENTTSGCVATALGVALVAWMLHSCSQTSERMDKEREKAAAEQAKQEEAIDRQKAHDHGMSLEEYQRITSAGAHAYAACKVAAENRAMYGYKSDFVPNWSSNVVGKDLEITGRDIQMQNGFGAYSYVTYRCVWSVSGNTIKSLDVID